MSDISKKIEEMESALSTADHCLSCTSCMSSCPVMEAEKSYRGPKLVGPAHSRMHFSQDDFDQAMNRVLEGYTWDNSALKDFLLPTNRETVEALFSRP